MPTKRYSLLICDTPPLIWYRIPRAASHTIHAALHTLGVRKPILYSETESTIRADKRHGDSRYFKFTFVRNPWDRFVSTWKYFSEKAPETSSMTVDQFIAHLETNPDLRLDLHVRPQIDLIPIDWRTLDFVGRMESLNEDLKHVVHECFRDVDSCRISTLHLNDSKQTRTIDGTDLRKMNVYVEEKYKEDIRLLGYGETARTTP